MDSARVQRSYLHYLPQVCLYKLHLFCKFLALNSIYQNSGLPNPRSRLCAKSDHNTQAKAFSVWVTSDWDGTTMSSCAMRICGLADPHVHAKELRGGSSPVAHADMHKQRTIRTPAMRRKKRIDHHLHAVHDRGGIPTQIALPVMQGLVERLTQLPHRKIFIQQIQRCIRHSCLLKIR